MSNKSKAGYHPEKSCQKNELKKAGFYKWPVWRKLRLLALQRDNYVCQLKISKKCTRVATEVHHIKPISEYPEFALELDNLVSVCWYCHEETKHRGITKATPEGVRVIQMNAGSE